MNAIAKQDKQIVEATKELGTLGLEVKRAGLRTKVYRQGVPMSKWLEPHQLVGMVRFYIRKATPMELALLKAGVTRSRA